jgi:ferrous iron transport protein A
MVIGEILLKTIRKVKYMKIITLNKIAAGCKGVILDNNTTGEACRRFADIGLIKGAEIECVGESPLGDPIALYLNGAVIALRRADITEIKVAVIENE